MAEKLKKTKSYFTIKEKRHQKVSEGTIFERDYMTLNSLGGWPGKTFPYGEGNFKMLTGNEVNVARKHNFGKWAKTESGSTIWGYDDFDAVAQNSNLSQTSQAEVNPNTTSLLSFAYYGSCVEVVKNTIASIIKKFPGELYVGREIKEDIEGLDGKCRVENPFNIDIVSDSGKDDILKSFADGSSYYEVIDNSGNTVDSVKWGVEHNKNINLRCLMDGDIINEITITDNFIIEEVFYGGKKLLVTDKSFMGYHIRPKQSYIGEIRDGFTDLEKILLNFDSKPLYTAVLDNPHEDLETGKIITYQKKFTWPTRGGWNLDIETSRYSKYLGELLELADFYDKNYSDNIWRSMTHDSIKNMDRAYLSGDVTSDDYNEGTTRIEALLHSYGHFFDNFKFCIDSLKNSNKISYDGNNNAPDCFLYNENEISGWEMTNPVSSLQNIKTNNIDFGGTSKEYTLADAEKQFLRNLKLNTRSIFSKKGTREGIEELLSLFGFESEDHAVSANNADYSISEYVTVLKPNEDSAFEVESGETFPIEEWNRLKKTYSDENDGYNEDTLEGLPVKIVYGENGMKYLVPWFFTGSTIDGEPYFQMYGGWGKRYKKEIENELAPNITEIRNGIFEETEKYIKYAASVDSLEEILPNKVSKGDIFYVADVTDYKKSVETPEEVSNYFICIDDSETGNITEGWENIPNNDIKQGKGNGIKVLYLESLIDEIKGNNPHTGFGNYDDGQEYYKIFSQIFKYSIENDNFKDGAYKCSEDLEDIIIKSGFENAEKLIKDNVKCWYFKPNSENGNKNLICKNHEDEVIFNNGKEKAENGETLYTSELNPYDYELKTVSSREMASYSVMNTKRMEIHFNVEKFKGNEDFISEYKKFINENILPYLKQIIPSTTIWWLRIGDERFGSTATSMDKIPNIKRYKVDGAILNRNIDGELKTFKVNARRKISTLVDMQENGKSI